MPNWFLGMARFLRIVLLSAAPSVLFAQSVGVSTEWDVRKMLDALTNQTQHLKSVLSKVNTADMTANGAPQTYMTQWNTAQTELRYVLNSIDALSKQPERLSLALDAYFRMEAMESTVGSAIEGLRKYENPSLADFLRSVADENSTNRDHLRQYIQDLAVEKEQEFQVADKEAQRCRGMIAREPNSSTRGKGK